MSDDTPKPRLLDEAAADFVKLVRGAPPLFTDAALVVVLTSLVSMLIRRAVADEREACAKLAETMPGADAAILPEEVPNCYAVAAAIRKRGNQ